MHAEWDFTTDAAAFLAGAGALLAADPVNGTVVSTVAEREAARAAAEPGSPTPPEVQWFASLRRPGGEVVGVAMRTAPFDPRPAFVLPVPGPAALALARELHGRGEWLGGVNGALPAARVVADETARLWGATARVEEETRLYELGDLVDPPAPPGRLRLAEPDDPDDVALCTAWFRRFEAAAAAQAGRAPGNDGSHETEQAVRGRLRERRVWLWIAEDGTPVHLVGASLPAYGVSRIGPVLTPEEHRGRGYASAAVAAVARQRRDAGARVCLFTDQANPVSNHVYRALGFVPVVDMANVLVVPPGEEPG